MEIERNKVDKDLTHRRMGGAFDLLGKTFRKVVLIIFGNGFNIRNRPGLNVDQSLYLQTGLIDVKSMTECYYDQPSINGINAYVVGRTGDGQKRNLHFADFSVDHRTEIGNGLGFVNGVFRVRVSRDGVDEEIRDGIYVMDRGTRSTGREGTDIQIIGSGEGGVVHLAWATNKSDHPVNDTIYDLYVDANGITMLGLPTSSPGGAGRLWNDAGTLKIT